MDYEGRVGGSTASAKMNAAPTPQPSDTLDGMINLLGHPIAELSSAVERLRMLGDRITGPRPPSVVGGTGGGELRKEPSMQQRFTERHAEIQMLVNAVHAEINRLEQAI